MAEHLLLVTEFIRMVTAILISGALMINRHRIHGDEPERPGWIMKTMGGSAKVQRFGQHFGEANLAASNDRTLS